MAQQFVLQHPEQKSDRRCISLTPGGMEKNTRHLADIYSSFLRGTGTKKPLQSSTESCTADPPARQAINTLSRKQENSPNDSL